MHNCLNWSRELDGKKRWERITKANYIIIMLNCAVCGVLWNIPRYTSYWIAKMLNNQMTHLNRALRLRMSFDSTLNATDPIMKYHHHYVDYVRVQHDALMSMSIPMLLWIIWKWLLIIHLTQSGNKKSLSAGWPSDIAKVEFINIIFHVLISMYTHLTHAYIQLNLHSRQIARHDHQLNKLEHFMWSNRMDISSTN